MFDHILALKILLTYVDLMNLQPPCKLAILQDVRFGKRSTKIVVTVRLLVLHDERCVNHKL